jgi:CBS domain-containing protein
LKSLSYLTAIVATHTKNNENLSITITTLGTCGKQTSCFLPSFYLFEGEYLFETNRFNAVSVVSEIMPQKALVTVDINDSPSALDVAKLMTKYRIGSVVVIEGSEKKPLGIVTERDIISKVSAQTKTADQVTVKQIMSSPVITVKSIDSIDTAAETMAENKVKRLVVLEQDGSMVGILSVSDIARKLAKILTEDYSRYRSLRNLLDMS